MKTILIVDDEPRTLHLSYLPSVIPRARSADNDFCRRYLVQDVDELDRRRLKRNLHA